MTALDLGPESLAVLRRIAAALEARNAEDGISPEITCSTCGSSDVVTVLGGGKSVCKNCGASQEEGGRG